MSVLFNVSLPTVYRYFQTGLIKAVKIRNKTFGKRLHDDVLHISKKPLRGELSGFLSICQAEASCISPKVY